MRDHLETAPVIDALRRGDGCPVCQLRQMIEQQSVERFLGGAVMEPEIRLMTNAAGFCRQHHILLMQQKDYHGYALMMQTRLRQVADDLRQAADDLAGAGMLGRKKTDHACAQVRSATQRCLICENMDSTVARYIDILLKLYREDAAFRKDFEAGARLCLRDLPMVVAASQGKLSPSQRAQFLSTLSAQLKQSLATAQQDLDALCSSFHYGSEQKNNPRIHLALERAVNLLRGKTFDEG